MSNTNGDCREILNNYGLLIALVIFVVVYVCLNYNVITNDNIYAGNISKSVMISAIIFLVLYILVNWDDEDDDARGQVMTKYKIVNNGITNRENSDVKIENKYNNKYSYDNKNENSNIFINQKNKSKFGIKF